MLLRERLHVCQRQALALDSANPAPTTTLDTGGYGKPTMLFSALPLKVRIRIDIFFGKASSTTFLGNQVHFSQRKASGFNGAFRAPGAMFHAGRPGMPLMVMGALPQERRLPVGVAAGQAKAAALLCDVPHLLNRHLATRPHW